VVSTADRPGDNTAGGEQSDPLAALDEVLGPTHRADGTTADRAPQPPLTRHTDVHAFVTDYLARVWARVVRDPDNAFRWCAKWWDHPVALDRLTALWHAYEALHNEGGTGPARWWREHADPTLTVLTDPRTGPFAGCGPQRHQLPPELPSDLPDTRLAATVA
jgi:hypothetical protein